MTRIFDECEKLVKCDINLRVELSGADVCFKFDWYSGGMMRAAEVCLSNVEIEKVGMSASYFVVMQFKIARLLAQKNKTNYNSLS